MYACSIRLRVCRIILVNSGPKIFVYLRSYWVSALSGSSLLFTFLFSWLQAKLDKSAGRPSKVIHLRNIPSEVSEAEIIHLGIPFGRVTNVLVLKGKNQVSRRHICVFILTRYFPVSVWRGELRIIFPK